MSLAAAIPEDASPSAGRYEHPTTDPQPPVGTMPTGPHAEAEAAAIQAAHSGAPDEARYVPTGLVMFGSILTADQVGVIPDPVPRDADAGRSDWPEAPSYSTTSTGRVLAAIDEQIGDSLGQRNQALRAQLRGATGELARERSLRRDAQSRLAQVTSERDSLAVKLAETERALNVVGAAIKHAIRHDEKGGESDG